MKIDGGCHCGYIKFEAEIDPAEVAICHCTDCQSLSGSAFRTVVPASSASYKLSGGEPTVYVKTAESGNRRAQGFCPKCGTPLYSSALTDPATCSLRVGTIRQRAELPPRFQYWARSARDWTVHLGELPRYEKQK